MGNVLAPFAGPLAEEWSQLANLQSVDLSYNNLTGTTIAKRACTFLLISYIQRSHAPTYYHPCRFVAGQLGKVIEHGIYEAQ